MKGILPKIKGGQRHTFICKIKCNVVLPKANCTPQMRQKQKQNKTKRIGELCKQARGPLE